MPVLLSSLLRLKHLRKEQALVALQKKREEVVSAEQALKKASEEVQLSARALPIKEDLAYDAIIKKTVSMNVIEKVKCDISAIRKEHAALVNVEERAAHVSERLKKELEQANSRYHLKVVEEEKYENLVKEAKKQADAEEEYKEEVETEDVTSTKHRRAGCESIITIN